MARKVGDLSHRFGLHGDTIRDWVDMYEELFSPKARKGEGTRRVFTPEDEELINTINEFRKERMEFEEIRARLAAGERVKTLPNVNDPVPAESALTVYNELRELRTRIEERDVEVERLRSEMKAQTEMYERLRSEEREKLQERIIRVEGEKRLLEYQLQQALKGKSE